jgi:hypothetical protein
MTQCHYNMPVFYCINGTKLVNNNAATTATNMTIIITLKTLLFN